MKRDFFENDTMYEIMHFLTFEEILNVGKTCKSLRKTIQDDAKLWKMLCLHRIAPIQAPEHPKHWTENILSCLCLPNYYSLYAILKDATINPLNYYWTEAPQLGKGYLEVVHDNGEIAAGNLMCFQHAGGQFFLFGNVLESGNICYEFTKHTTCHLDFNSNLCRFQRVHDFDGNDKGNNNNNNNNDNYKGRDTAINTIEFIGNDIVEIEREIVMVRESNMIEKSRAIIKSRRIYTPLPQDATSQSLSFSHPSALYSSSFPSLTNIYTYPPHFTKLLELQGLCTGVYGGHGIEILHCGITRNRPQLSMSLPSSSSSSSLVSGGNNYMNSIGHDELFLRGLKIQGDPNVPGWQMSWAVEIMNTVNINDVFVSDNRHIVQFQDNEFGARYMNKNERLHLIEYCFKGYGQINRHPGIWEPEWENILYIVYKRPLSAAESRNQKDGVVFSVIFCPNDNDYVHIIDYRALDNKDRLKQEWSLVKHTTCTRNI